MAVAVWHLRSATRLGWYRQASPVPTKTGPTTDPEGQGVGGCGLPASTRYEDRMVPASRPRPTQDLHNHRPERAGSCRLRFASFRSATRLGWCRQAGPVPTKTCTTTDPNGQGVAGCGLAASTRYEARMVPARRPRPNQDLHNHRPQKGRELPVARSAIVAKIHLP